MRIYQHMLNILMFPEKIAYELLAEEKYMTYIKESKSAVMQSHILTKEKGTLQPKTGSQHLDWRMQTNGQAEGWSIVGGNIQNPITPERLLEEKAKGFRAETKAKQPLNWMKVGGKRQFVEIGPGEPHGVMEKLWSGEWMSGAQKVWFHEYFLKGEKPFTEWTRIIVRAVKVKKLGPTKEAVPGRFERMWRVMVPEEECPYALKRGIEKNWKPPKGVIPFPEEWTKKKFPEEYKKWLEYMEKEEASLSQIRFTLSLASWMGPRAKTGRRMPQFRWYLLLDDKGKGGLRTFYIDGYPIKDTIMSSYEEERTNRKWLDYEGKTQPNSRFNENKELIGDYDIIDKGTVSYNAEREDNLEIISLVFKGNKLKGKYEMRQEEPRADFYSFEKLSEEQLEELAKGKFVLDSHEVPANSGKIHQDIRWYIEDQYLDEFNLYGNILDAKIEEPVRAVKKKCPHLEWIEIKNKPIHKKVGNIDTIVETIDHGSIEVIEDNPSFISFNINGTKLNGIYIGRKNNSIWEFMKSSLPRGSRSLSKYNSIYEYLQEGNPRTGKYMFEVEEKKGWNYFYIHIYDLRYFTRVESQDKVKEYFPDLTVPSGINIGIGLYSVPSKINNARVTYVKFNKEEWDYNKAEQWIKSNNLHTWEHPQIRTKREELRYSEESLKIWIEIIKLDVSAKEIEANILTKMGKQEITLFCWDDEMFATFLKKYGEGKYIFLVRVWRGAIMQILEELPKDREWSEQYYGMG